MYILCLLILDNIVEIQMIIQNLDGYTNYIILYIYIYIYIYVYIFINSALIGK